jgi:hypothetical protein
VTHMKTRTRSLALRPFRFFAFLKTGLISSGGFAKYRPKSYALPKKKR